MMSPSLFAILLSSQMIVPVADRVPNLNFASSCRESALSKADCLKDEQIARDLLNDAWPRFALRDKQSCAQETKLDATPSYIELLTCLRISEHDHDSPATAK
jgi:hypothetical protein